jgi:hypothetical protein
VKKVFLVSSLLFLVFLALPDKVLADCELASWQEGPRDMTVCVGEFSTVAELRDTTVEFHCTGNSNIPYGSFCRDIVNPTFDLANTPDNQIAQDGSGLYYTCITGYTLNRAIGSLDVIFTNGGTEYCRIDGLYTQPPDWDPLTEGLPWQQGSNAPSYRPYMCADQVSLDTAIGCIPITEANLFTIFIFRWAMGIGGGVAFLLILLAGFQIISSSGNPERLQAGRELLTSAVAGLLLLLFSIFILRLVGLDILGISSLGL